MKRIFIFSVLFFINTLMFAQDKPIRVGIDNFYPPYTIRAQEQFYGFDVELMSQICKLINKPCQFIPLSFPNLLAKLEAGEIDVAIGAITVTPERSEKIYFSKPYLLSQARFLAHKDLDLKTFDLDKLNDYKVGALNGTIFPHVLTSLGVKKSKINLYETQDFMIDALNEHTINIALMDNASALYWNTQSSEILIPVGKMFNYGYGVAIAINRNRIDLAKQIDTALEIYLKGDDFKKNYDKYLSYFNK